MSGVLQAADVARQLDKASRSGKGWKACCPAHADRNPSLVLYDRPDGFAYKCLAGCSSSEVRDALKRLDLLPTGGAGERASRNHHPEKNESGKGYISPIPENAPEPDWRRLLGWQPSMVYIYLDLDRALLLFVARLDRPEGGKDIRPVTYWRRDGREAEWLCRAPPTPRPLYGLDALASRPEASVLVVEGEKTADAAAALFSEHVVVTWQGGSSAVDHADWTPLSGRDVTLWPDNDDAGRRAMARIAAILTGGGA